ncbi:7TM diverse intracellular signaling domain-containing protein [Olivibacter sp. XZL3]|uniref:sensor histidine kinase n=1 Tax=Olivibacter sp. XZL3 TaxID=1735116 RepID=UPI001065692B|nr:7TM diverse intracellular signaling domain-containing protein [Olivibacter sp. XZL3]
MNSFSIFFKLRPFLILVTALLWLCKTGYAQGDQPIYFNDAGRELLLNRHIALFQDTSRKLSIDDVKQQNFVVYQNEGVINLGATTDKVWLRFSLQNNTDEENLYLLLQQASIEEAVLFMQDAKGQSSIDTLAKYKPFKERIVYAPDYIFPISIKKGGTAEIYLCVSSNDQLQLPLYIGAKEVISARMSTKNLLFGLYAGAILIMMLYNLFVGLSTQNSSYFYYIIYILTVGLTQALFQGYTYMYLWPNSPWLASRSSIIIPFLSGLATIAFIKNFLHTKTNTPKLDKGINVIVLCYFIGLLVGLFDVFSGAILLQTTASIGTLYVLYVAEQIRRKGYRPAVFFLLAFTLFFTCVIVFVLRNFNFVPYNTFTAYILEIGSIVEISLLSFALADRINFYRKEKEASQAQALQISQENARIIREQNLLLETEVNRRTKDLKKTNESLNEAMHNLKQAQAHLVESEKLASLGMLTAGIAHEINNPINFVTGSIKPLSRDVDQLIDALKVIEEIAFRDIPEEAKMAELENYKEDIDLAFLQEEIQLLLKGIQEGAFRTAEIVKSLRIFSRVDEDDLKLADINLGLESTLVILNSMFKDRINVKRHYDEIPYVECFPGKLNQVFLNLLTNAIHAIDEKFQGKQGGKITIKTYYKEGLVYISIKDNGVGIKEEVRNKIFDPFFTTKDVGEGTGLGLAIVSQTIAKHQGAISLLTEEGKGSEFIIRIPTSQPNGSQAKSEEVQSGKEFLPK